MREAVSFWLDLIPNDPAFYGFRSLSVGFSVLRIRFRMLGLLMNNYGASLLSTEFSLGYLCSNVYIAAQEPSGLVV